MERNYANKQKHEVAIDHRNIVGATAPMAAGHGSGRSY